MSKALGARPGRARLAVWVVSAVPCVLGLGRSGSHLLRRWGVFEYHHHLDHGNDRSIGHFASVDQFDYDHGAEFDLN